MALPTPPAQSSTPPPGDAAQLRRASLVPMVVAMVAVAGLAVYIFWQQNRPLPMALARPDVLMSDMQLNSESPHFDPLTQMSGHSTVSSMISLLDADVPLTAEQAPLGACPGAIWIGGTARTDIGGAETMVQWRVPSLLPATVEAYYLAAAGKEGFEPLGSGAQATVDASVRTRTLIRRHAASPPQERDILEMLTLRIAPLNPPVAPPNGSETVGDPAGAASNGGPGSSVLIWIRELKS